MTKLKQIYLCPACKNIVEVVREGIGELICCNQPMVLMEEKTADEGLEKHVPVVKKTATGYKVTVGSVSHPMEEKHFIEWIELIADGRVYRKNLSHKDRPEAEFCVKAKKVTAREHCNLHGLWKKEA
jgi:superoxide reductase